MKNLLAKWKPKGDEAIQAKKEACDLTDDFQRNQLLWT